jgi:glycosyltransferase involved in cell wall biosynthesis
MEAWRSLADVGLRPSLALTVDADTYPSLCRYVEDCRERYRLAVVNLGTLSSAALDTLYRSAGALIYPSKAESLGLPLIEATYRGLPILAPEVDYVRDLVIPVETFDPNSPTSVARAVRRFLGAPDIPVRVATAADFIAEVLQ